MSARNIIIKLLKTSDKDKFLKASREGKYIMNRGTKIK